MGTSARRNRKNGKRAIQSKAAGQHRLATELLEERRLLATFYVSDSNGSDSQPGSFQQPFETISKAASLARAGDTVFIREGTYREEVTLPRSGGAANPITFSAYNNEDVVVSGADLVTGWTPVAGMTDVWVATVDWNANNDRDANTLFVDGELKHEARQFADNDILDIDDWGLLPRNGSLQNDGSTLTAPAIAGFGNDYWNGGKVRFHTHDWIIETKTITDYRSFDGRITFDSPVGSVSLKQNNGFYVYDTLRALDKPGEWYKGKAADGTGEANKLYYRVSSGQNPNNLEVEFKSRGYGFDARGRDHISIEGLEFRGNSIFLNSSSDHVTIRGNEFVGYNKDSFGRMFLNGTENVIRDNEFHQSYISALSLGGQRNEVVNNYFHDIGFVGTSRVLDSGGSELLISHNTIRNFARSFLDGYPIFSEISHNLIEDGGNLSWDTGVFDADGTNGDSSYSIFHHNVIRDDSDTRGIFEGFYGRQNNAVIHHNLIYDFGGSSRADFRAYGRDFRQAYHNTFISDVSSAPLGELNALGSVLARYNNNLQITLEGMEALGVDLQGNYNYSSSDFVNFNNDDFRLAAGSGAIDAGIELPGINDGYSGLAPDAGAIEFGESMFDAGHDFSNPPTPVYSWQPLPGSNIFSNGQFNQGIDDWTVVSGSPDSRDRNSWNLQSGQVSLTGTFRTQSIEFTPGEALSRNFVGLKPNTTYTLGATARIIDEVTVGDEFNDSSGTITTGSHRLVDYATGLTSGEWVRYDVDFGAPDQFDLIEVLHKRSGESNSIAGTQLQIRLDSPTGPLLANFTNLTEVTDDWDHWFNDREAISNVSGAHSIYVSASGSNSANLFLGNLRLLKANVPPDNRLTATVTSAGAATVSTRLGRADWESGYETLTFTTGPAATTANVTFANNGQITGYLDRLYLIEGTAERGGTARNVSQQGSALLSLSPTSDGPANGVLDGDVGSSAETGDHANSWIQVDLKEQQRIDNLQLTAPSVSSDQISNFRVSVWSTDPRDGGHELWGQDYLTNGVSLGSGETFLVHSDQLGDDGVTTLGTVVGRFVRVQLVGQNNAGNHRLSIGEISVEAFDHFDLAISDGVASQSSTANGLSASNAIDEYPTSRSETLFTDTNSWWQVRFPQSFSIGQIELVAPQQSADNELSNFTVSVWDEDPSAGGSKLWEQTYLPTGGVEAGTSFRIAGDELSLLEPVRLGSVQGRLVRVQLNGTNNLGNGKLSLANVRIASSDNVQPATNVAISGTASMSSTLYGVRDLAPDANNGAVLPRAEFTSTENESGAWWQVDLGETPTIDQIVVFNRTDAASRLNNFRVSVWADDPNNGGSELWGRTYFYSSSAPAYSTNFIGPGGALAINGNVTSAGLRLDQVSNARFVRVQLQGRNILSLPEVQVFTPDAVFRTGTSTSFNFDVGTPASPLQGGWTRISPESHGDAWWEGNIDSDYQPAVNNNNINRDFVTSTEAASLNIRVPKGVYNLNINLGDGEQVRDNMMVWAEDELLHNDIDSSPSGVPFAFAGANGVEVRDGILNLRFDDAGDAAGAAAGWALTRLSLTRVADLPPGPDNALQLLVDANGRTLLRNTTGTDMSLTGYTITNASGALLTDGWVGLGQQAYAGQTWTESSATATSLAETGSAINIPNGGQIYIGKLLDTSASQSLNFQFQLAGGAMEDGYFEMTNVTMPRLVGDYNDDLIVDAADFTAWRDQLGDPTSPFMTADGNGDGIIDASDRVMWVAHFGDAIANATLIDASTGNGSFEDWGGSAATRILGNSGTFTIPGWTATPVAAVGGWLRAGDSAATAGAASDGTAYAFAAGGATTSFTSDPISGYTTNEGDEFEISLDAGSRDGVPNTYTVSLLFGGQESVVASFTEDSNVTTAGLVTHTFNYLATAADAGTTPAVRIVASTGNGFSQSYLDNVVVNVAEGTAPIVLATTAAVELPARIPRGALANPQVVTIDANVRLDENQLSTAEALIVQTLEVAESVRVPRAPLPTTETVDALLATPPENLQSVLFEPFHPTRSGQLSSSATDDVDEEDDEDDLLMLALNLHGRKK